MKKRMQPLTVEITEDGQITLSQEAFGNDDQMIILSPDQIDVLVQWLQEAKSELMSGVTV